MSAIHVAVMGNALLQSLYPTERMSFRAHATNLGWGAVDVLLSATIPGPSRSLS